MFSEFLRTNRSDGQSTLEHLAGFSKSPSRVYSTRTLVSKPHLQHTKVCDGSITRLPNTLVTVPLNQIIRFMLSTVGYGV